MASHAVRDLKTCKPTTPAFLLKVVINPKHRKEMMTLGKKLISENLRISLEIIYQSLGSV